MSFFEHRSAPPQHPLPAEQVAHYRRVLVAHANQSGSGACPTCRQQTCPTWRDAFDQVAAAGELMAEPGPPQSTPEPESQ